MDTHALVSVYYPWFIATPSKFMHLLLHGMHVYVSRHMYQDFQFQRRDISQDTICNIRQTIILSNYMLRK